MKDKIKKNKVLYLSPSYSFFGAEKILFELINNLDKSKFEPILLIPLNCNYKNYFSEMGCMVYEIDIKIPAKIMNLFRILKANYLLILQTDRIKPSVVHMNLCFHLELMLPFFVYLKLKKIPIFFHVQTHSSFNALERFIMLKGKIIFVSKILENRFFAKRRSDILTRPNRNKTKTIYNGVDLSKFSFDNHIANEIRREFNLKDEIVVGMVGAIDERKRQDLFIRMADSLKKDYHKIKFIIVGDTYDNDISSVLYKKKIYKMVEDLKLEEDIIFTGYRNDVNRIMQAMDIFILPSKREAFGIVIIEAMALGIPVVATAVDGIIELIDDGKSGILMHTDDPYDWHKEILLLLKDKVRLSKMKTEAKEKARKFFDIKNCALDMQNLYTTSISKTK